jgi:hypothetical protein
VRWIVDLVGGNFEVQWSQLSFVHFCQFTGRRQQTGPISFKPPVLAQHAEFDREPVDVCKAIEVVRERSAPHCFAKEAIEFRETLACQRHGVADYLVGHVRFWCVEWRGVMTNVLRGKKDALGQRLEKDSRLDEPRYGFESETADRFHFSTDFVELRDVIGVKVETFETVEILTTGMLRCAGPRAFQIVCQTPCSSSV